MKYAVTLIVAVILIAAGHYFWVNRTSQESGTGASPIATVSYQCNEGKTITAVYYEGESKPAAGPDEPPTPGGSVMLTLSDGRTMTLAQTISASGIRYSDGNPNVEGDETFVFWSKGNSALVLEHNTDRTFTDCIKIADDPGGLPRSFESGAEGFSIRYADGFSVDPNYQYQELGPGNEISGVKFTIPASMATGTNLSPDTYFSVETISLATSTVSSCEASLFLDVRALADEPASITENGITYSVASSTDAAAGNRYEETVYAIPGTNPCIAVRYHIHYGVFENYEPGTVKRFDRSAVIDQFDAMRKTLILGQ